MSGRNGRPVVNIAVVRRNAAGKIVASVSKGCHLRIGKATGTALRFSCIKVRRRGRIIAPRAGILGIVVSRGTRLVSRIIIITCKAHGGKAVTNSMSAIGTSGVRGIPATKFSRTLRKRTPNLAMVSGSKRPDGTTSFRVQKAGSVGSKATPLFVLSKVPVSDTSFGALDPDSVRSMAILGSTSSASVCNTQTTGNMIIVAAGHNIRLSGTGIALHTRCNVSRLTTKGG